MENISSALLDWFYKNHRILPFRTDPSPYHVWLSELEVFSSTSTLWLIFPTKTIEAEAAFSSLPRAKEPEAI